jgi:hypothetical protein
MIEAGGVVSYKMQIKMFCQAYTKHTGCTGHMGEMNSYTVKFGEKPSWKAVTLMMRKSWKDNIQSDFRIVWEDGAWVKLVEGCVD